MSAPSWADLEALFHEALARGPAERAAFLAERCAGRLELHAEVEALIRTHESTASALERPPMMPLQTRLKAGMRLGSYEVLSALGAGAMGEVYRARDIKLGRDVAIKILPTAFTADPERLARFEREARVLATLNHPHIGAIYGFEEHDGLRALVLELVEGTTLADRITRGDDVRRTGPFGPAGSAGSAGPGLHMHEALTIARQVAEALEAAHDKGIIHRDLKPANIKITPAGVVKVLDFGLAKVFASDGSGLDLSQSPTVTATALREGAILGTPAYMSPEQARGQAVDKRTDIWAFGCVLYEMLTGRRAFESDDASDTLAAILRAEPDWSALPPQTPAAIRRLLRRCLEKDRKDRQRDIGDASVDIREALTAPSADAATVTPSPSRFWGWRRITPLAVGAFGAATLGGAVVWLTMRPAPPRVTRTEIASPRAEWVWIDLVRRSVAITPDGTRVVYVGNNGLLFVRAMDRLEATALSGLGTPSHPFLSPDGEWIGFFDGNTMLKKVAITGGPAVMLCPVGRGGPRGATWGADGTIIFAEQAPSSGLWRVSSAGGKPALLTTPNPERGEADHLWPEYLPGAHAVLFTITPVTGSIDNAQVAVLDLRTGTHKILVSGGSHAHYLPSGHLVYGVGGTLRAVAFDLDRLEAVGTPTPVLQNVITTPFGAAEFDVARDGTLVYVSGAQTVANTLVWVDRQGREEPIKAPVRAYASPRLSPDGSRLALGIQDQENDIWIWDFGRETLTRFTFDAGFDQAPVWTPDGRRLLFGSRAAGAAFNVFWQAADGTGSAERLTQSPNRQVPFSVFPDGTGLVLGEAAPTRDVMTLALDLERSSTLSASSARGEPVDPRRLPRPSASSGEPERSSASDVRPLIQTPYAEQNAEISPDGRWLAYESNNTGQQEIYVRPFPNVNSGLWQISTGGGTKPLWARNGQELFYRTPMGAVMSVRIERGATWAASTHTKLFEGRDFTGEGWSERTYDVAPDGQRFLMIKQDPQENALQLVVVQNWQEELKRLVPKK